MRTLFLNPGTIASRLQRQKNSRKMKVAIKYVVLAKDAKTTGLTADKSYRTMPAKRQLELQNAGSHVAKLNAKAGAKSNKWMAR